MGQLHATIIDYTDLDSNPTNFKFVQGDIEKAWDWLPDRPVDFLTIRGLFGILDNWTELFRKAMRYLFFIQNKKPSTQTS